MLVTVLTFDENEYIESILDEVHLTHPSEMMEEDMTNKYQLLATRIPGFAMKPSEIWDEDSKTTGQIYSNEVERIKKEQQQAEEQQRQAEGKGHIKYQDESELDEEEVDAYESLFMDDD